MKILIVVTHLLGVGHLARAAALGRALARAGHAVTLVSGGRPAPTVPMTGIDLVQLPPIHVQGTDFKTLFSEEELATPEFLARRRAILAETARRVRPDAVIVELYPFGRRQLQAEIAELLDELVILGGEQAVFASVRDVLAPPSKSSKIDQTETVLARHFDRVLVHGDATVLPLEASWPVSRGLAQRLAYTGYVRDSEATEDSATPAPSGEVLVSGGGSSASLPLMQAALGAARMMPGQRWRLLVGHGVPAEAFDRLQKDAPANAVVERARRDFDTLLRGAACSVSQAGYNTMLDLAATGVPAVVVPFSAGKEVEQTIRAERFAAMGLCETVNEAELSAATLESAVRRALSRGRQKATLALDGAARSVALLKAGVADKQAEAAAWRRLDAVLDRYGSEGREARFWWRDDDAVAPTPELDRLLDLARRHDAPVALAVIPEGATPALAARLAEEPLVSVLVHGIAHRNNAPAGRKKQELVDGVEGVAEGLRSARQRLSALFGPQALPVLVPPWNRIDPACAAALAGLGFRGLSTYGPEEKMADLVGIRRLNTHFDPIDWKAGGGLVCVVPHIAALADLLEKRLVQNGLVSPPAAGPVGLLTHHLVHDPWVWAFMDRLLDRLRRHRAVRFVHAGASFGLT